MNEYIKFETSDNGYFKINCNKKNILYIRNDIYPELKKYDFLEKINANTLNGIIKLKKYSIFKYSFNVKNTNSLQFAESLALNNPEYSDKNGIFQEKSTKLDFGYIHNDNLKIIDKIIDENKNNNVIADEEECFAIIKNIEDDPDKDIENCYYHIGFILFKDGNSYVTLENNLKEPKFEYYSKKQTFHSIHESNLQPNPSTIVLKKKDENNNIQLYNLDIKLKSIDKLDDFISNNEEIKLTLELPNEDIENSDHSEDYKDIENGLEDIDKNTNDTNDTNNTNDDNIILFLLKKITGLFIK